jgi:hypothetical protein
MRYIKSYKIFESIDNLVDNLIPNIRKEEHIKREIEDILIPLKDIGCKTSVALRYDLHSMIWVMFLSYDSVPVKWSDIEDEFLRVIDSIKNEYITDVIYYKEVREDGRVFNRNTRDDLPLEEFLEYVNNKGDVTLAHLSFTLYQYIPHNKKWFENN